MDSDLFSHLEVPQSAPADTRPAEYPTFSDRPEKDHPSSSPSS